MATKTNRQSPGTATEDAPVLEQLVVMNLNSMEESGLDAVSYHLVRLAALVAMDAPPISYLINLELAGEAGMTLEQAQGALIAISPLVGSARVASAATNVLRAYGLGEATQA